MKKLPWSSMTSGFLRNFLALFSCACRVDRQAAPRMTTSAAERDRRSMRPPLRRPKATPGLTPCQTLRVGDQSVQQARQFGDRPDPVAVHIGIEVRLVDQHGRQAGGAGTGDVDVVDVADVNRARMVGAGNP